MTSDYNKNLWNTVLAELKKKIPVRKFDLWFKDTEIVSYTKEVMTIYVHNEVIQKRISETSIQDIKDAVFKCCGDSPEIEFASQSEKDQHQQTFFDFEEKINDYWQDNDPTPLPQAEKPNIVQQQLNDLYTFENFVVGPSNQLAHAAALAVANKPGKAYNPLFMYGAVGLGKSHLLQAICHEVLKKKSGYSIVYISCEEFINQFIAAVEKGKGGRGVFRDTFKYLDILVIDDIHFLAGKEGTQEEFFHTFNSLYNSQKQIIISSDSPPSDIPELKERLVSRFKWGLVSQIDIPTFETRVAIVKKKSRLKGNELKDNVCQYVSENIVSNIRELEGAINHLFALSELHKQEITLDFTKTYLSEIIDDHEPAIRIPDILTIVAKHFNVTLSELQSKKRNQSIVKPRQIGMYLAKKLTSYSLQEIGSFFGKRDHTTVIHAVEKIKEQAKSNQELHELLIDFEHQISGNKKA